MVVFLSNRLIGDVLNGSFPLFFRSILSIVSSASVWLLAFRNAYKSVIGFAVSFSVLNPW